MSRSHKKLKVFKLEKSQSIRAKSRQEKREDQEGEVEEPQFESEMEFFLHFLWSSRGYHIEDNSDEYYNLKNTQSTLAVI